MLTLKAVVCLPNKVRPFTPRWAEIWAGPVSFAITNELSLIKLASCDISRALPLSKIETALMFFASSISEGPGATTTLIWFPYLFLINSISSL